MSNIEVKRLEGPYAVGKVVQQCGSCGETTRSKQILAACPQCGAAYEDPPELHFGGMRVAFNRGRNRFVLRDPQGGGTVTLYDADVPDTLRFVLALWESWSGEVGAGGLGGLRRLRFWKNTDG